MRPLEDAMRKIRAERLALRKGLPKPCGRCGKRWCKNEHVILRANPGGKLPSLDLIEGTTLWYN